MVPKPFRITGPASDWTVWEIIPLELALKNSLLRTRKAQCHSDKTFQGPPSRERIGPRFLGPLGSSSPNVTSTSAIQIRTTGLGLRWSINTCRASLTATILNHLKLA